MSGLEKYNFYTRDSVALMLREIGNEELATRYLKNTKQLFVYSENPVKNSFKWKGTEEGVDFWYSISEALDSALLSNPEAFKYPFVTGTQVEAHWDVTKYLKPQFQKSATSSTWPNQAFSSIDELMEYLSSEAGEEEVTGKDVIDDAAEFADDMIKLIKTEAIKKILKNKKNGTK